MTIKFKVLPEIKKLNNCRLLVEKEESYDDFFFRCQESLATPYAINLVTPDRKHFKLFEGKSAEIIVEKDFKRQMVQSAKFNDFVAVGRTPTGPKDGVYLFMMLLHLVLSGGLGKVFPIWIIRNTGSVDQMIDFLGIRRK